MSELANNITDLTAFRERRKNLVVPREAAILTQAFNTGIWPSVALTRTEEKQRDALMRIFGMGFGLGHGSSVMLFDTESPESCEYSANTIMHVLHFWGINRPGVQSQGHTSHALGEVRKTNIPVQADLVETVVASTVETGQLLPKPGEFLTLNFQRQKMDMLVYLIIPVSPEYL